MGGLVVVVVEVLEGDLEVLTKFGSFKSISWLYEGKGKKT
jgi:hypothetical protein